MQNHRHYHSTYRDALKRKIEALNSQVFVRSDLEQTLSNKEQLRLNRALQAFRDEGIIEKISHGLYAKAMKIHLPNGETKVVLREPFESVVMEALDKLQLNWELGEAIQAYNRGETTQIPANFSVKLHSRFRGKIQAEGRTVIFEENINAR